MMSTILPMPNFIFIITVVSYLMQTPARGICVLWLQWTNSHGLLSPVEEKGLQGHSLKRRTAPPCLDRLLLLVWAHYIEDGPHLLCTGLL